jgi:hypothetical protein
MKQVLTSSAMLIALVMLTALAQAQSHGSESRRQIEPSDRPGTMRPLGSLRDPRFSPPDSYIPPRSPDLGSATSPLSPSIGPGSGLLGPESGRGPMRLRSGTEAGQREAATDSGER